MLLLVLCAAVCTTLNSQLTLCSFVHMYVLCINFNQTMLIPCKLCFNTNVGFAHQLNAKRSNYRVEKCVERKFCSPGHMFYPCLHLVFLPGQRLTELNDRQALMVSYYIIYCSVWADQRRPMASYRPLTQQYTPCSCDCREYIVESRVHI